jgi:uncharacterized membrane protein YedE/YeeE
MHPFVSAALGGALIGLSAVLLMGLIGRIAGVSGIVANLLPPTPAPGSLWRIGFLAGLVLGPLAVALITGDTGIGAPAVPLVLLIPAGVLVGVGTTLGSGCTSGHGICGLARLSPRSIVAVATFMGAGIATVFLVRHVL